VQVSSGKSRVVRFGVFDVDLEEAELRKSGIRIKLREQSFQILAMLLERPGHIVSREEIQQRLWPGNTFVDFDHSLNSSIHRLREALGDDPDSPRFVETVHRRGYRFIAPVETTLAADNPATEETKVPPIARPGRKGSAYVIAALIAALAGLMAAVALDVGGIRQRLFHSSRAPQIDSIAVLPVRNFSGDPRQDFFADGMTDGLIAGLAQLKSVKVVSTTSAMHYKNTTETMPRIAQELGVKGIVEVSVVRSGNHVRATAQLIDAQHDRHLWAATFDRDMADVLALQSDLVRSIADEIRARITPAESERLHETRRVDPEVYDDTLRARAILEYAMTEDQFRQATDLFQKAADRDPNYAPAWAGLGEALWSQAAYGFEFVAPSEVHDRAVAAAEKALQLDERLPEAHNARAIIAYDGDWDLDRAKHEFERAIELRPGYAASHNLYGQLLIVPLLRVDEAHRQFDIARELDPLSPWNDANLTLCLFYEGQYQKTLQEGERLLRHDPADTMTHTTMGGAWLSLGQPDRAIAELETVVKLSPAFRPTILGPLGLAYGRAGRRADAQEILEKLEQASKKRYISPYYIAMVYAGLGRMDEGFRELNRALGVRSTYLIPACSPIDPGLAEFRRDPRWKSFIERFKQKVRIPPGIPNPYS
jgi:TolB-like protein/DNA-binding winged helix-turn-helix (wHTH) protein